MTDRTAANKALVIKAITEAFIDRDPTAIDRYWDGAAYIQHTPTLPNGVEKTKEMIAKLGPGFTFELGRVVAAGDFVMFQSRHNFLTERPAIMTLIRVQNGKLAEAWEVIQPEVPAGETASGNPMFTPV